MNPKIPASSALSFVAATLLGLATVFLPWEWACSAFPLALLCGAAAFIVNFLPQKRRSQSIADAPNSKWKRPFVILAILCALILAWECYRATMYKRETFLAAFNTTPPADVTHISIENHYAGGPGDFISMMRFHAPAVAMQQILSTRRFKEDKDMENMYSQGILDWDVVWRKVGNIAASHNSDWERILPMKRPHIYEWRMQNPTSESVDILWDEDTGEAYAVHLAG